MKNSSFRSQFISAFAITLVLSVVCTSFVWGGSLYYLITNGDKYRPANYYEQQLPAIIQFASQHYDLLLSPDFQETFEEVIPLEGIDYQVAELSGEVIYGSLGNSLLSGTRDVVSKLNTTEYREGGYMAYSPVMDREDRLAGVLIIRYSLSLMSNNHAQAGFFIIGNLAAPFLFLLLFTILFARRIGKRLEPPITKLINGAGRIQKQDLNFTLADVGGSKEIKQLAAAFEDMRSALHTSLTAQWQLEQERRDMVSAIAHDLRTPLTIVQGHVDNLLENRERQAERLDKYLQTIRKNTDRAVQLLNDMSAVSDIDRPDFTLRFQQADLISLCRNKEEEYRLLCAARHIGFHMSIRAIEGHSGWMNVDVQRLEQMLDNVIGNSLRFTPEGGRIEWSVDIGQDQAVMVITDNGPGFNEADLPRLFDKFYQGDASRSIDKGHAGLGLYIVKALAEKHGGEAAAGNRQEGGAYVKLIIKEPV